MRITGAAGLLGALLELGLLGRRPRADRRLDVLVADDGQRIPVRTLGAGPPVVLVHGLGCSHRHWLGVARRLQRQHRVYAWDARGHGRCDLRDNGTVTLARLAADLRQLLDHFGIERAALVGHSMGALAVLQYLQDHGSDRVAAVALVDQSPRLVTDGQWRLGLFGGCSEPMLLGLLARAREDPVETIAAAIAAAGGGWLAERLHAQAALGRWLRRRISERGGATAPLADLAESLVRADFRALVPTLDVPLWVVLGGRSPHYGGVPLAEYYRRAVPHAAVSVYPRAGHSPHVAEPARFAAELLRFLADHA